MPKLSYICPYCFNEHKMTDVDFRCMNRRCEQVEDIPYGQYYAFKNPPMMQRTFHSDKAKGMGMPSRAVCPNCHEESNVRLCPSCHNVLPSAVEKNNEMIISLIGTRGSGKSNYVAVLVNQLKKHIAMRFNGAAKLMTDEDKRQYDKRFGDFVYGPHPKVIPATDTDLRGQEIIKANRPILCDFKVGKKRRLLGDLIIPYTFVFFDAAGENFEDQEVMRTVSKYIGQSEGIIFLIDPFQIPTVRRSFEENSDVVKGAAGAELGTVSSPAEVIDRVASLVRANKHMKEEEKVPIPVSVAFSKLDAIESLLPGTSILKKESPHVKQGSFVERDQVMVNSEMLGLLNEWDEQDFLAELKMNYANYSLSAFSALGSNPDPKTGSIAVPRPHRIEDGFLWILKENNVIPSLRR